MRSKYSRLERHNTRQANRQAFFYVVLSIVFIGVMLKWGLPLMIGLVTGFNQADEIEEASSTLKPQRPILSPLAEATYSATLDIEGSGQSDTTVKLRLNGLDLEEITPEADGSFVFENVELLEGENQLEVRAYKDDLESDAAVATIFQDDDEPKIKINSPEEEHKFFGMDQKNLTIDGEISEKAQVVINGSFVQLNSENKFLFQTTMVEGPNDFTITVTDRAGNKIERLFRVFYTR